MKSSKTVILSTDSHYQRLADVSKFDFFDVVHLYEHQKIGKSDVKYGDKPIIPFLHTHKKSTKTPRWEPLLETERKRKCVLLVLQHKYSLRNTLLISECTIELLLNFSVLVFRTSD